MKREELRQERRKSGIHKKRDRVVGQHRGREERKETYMWARQTLLTRRPGFSLWTLHKTEKKQMTQLILLITAADSPLIHKTIKQMKRDR